jgi:hypothetical protein
LTRPLTPGASGVELTTLVPGGEPGINQHLIESKVEYIESKKKAPR